MSDAPDGAAVFRLIYRSRSLLGAERRREELGEIFATARRTNRGLGVTGALVVSEDGFVQALEGEEATVRELYATIATDPRHDEVTTLEEGVVGERVFGRWSMARASEDGRADIRLMSNASAGVIVAAPGGHPPTPEQAPVLAAMRSALGVASA